MTTNKIILDKIHKILDDVRPYLQADGGDIEFLSLSRNMTVKVRLTGACMECPINQQTFNAIAQNLKSTIPEIKKVLMVE